MILVPAAAGCTLHESDNQQLIADCITYCFPVCCSDYMHRKRPRHHSLRYEKCGIFTGTICDTGAICPLNSGKH